MAADIATTLDAWSSTAASNQPDYADAVGPNTLADNQRTLQSVVRDAVAGSGTIASAATTDLSTVNDNYINVTGSTGPITSFGTLTAGIVKILKFASTPTITYNATSMILVTLASKTYAAGDVSVFRSEGSGNWRELIRMPAVGYVGTGDLQSQTATAFTTGGTGTAFTLTPTSAISAYTAGQEWDVSFSTACGAAPTFAVSGLASPPNLVKQNADGTYSNLASGDFPSGWTSKVKMVSATQALVRSLPIPLLTVANTFTKAQRGAITALTDAATIAVDLSLANNFSVTLAGNRTLGAPTNVVAGQSGIITITQDATGGRTLAYNAFWKFAGGTDPVLTTAANAVDVFAYFVNATGYATCSLMKDVK